MGGFVVGELAAAFAALATRLCGGGFEVSEDPLLRLCLVRVGTAEWVLLFSAHHLVMDGWSLSVLVGELGSLYRGEALAPLSVSYADYAAWQREWLAGSELERQLGYWPSVVGSAGGAFAADGPSAAGGEELCRVAVRTAASGRVDERATRTEPIAGSDTLHDAAGGLCGSLAPLQRRRETWLSAARSPIAGRAGRRVLSDCL